MGEIFLENINLFGADAPVEKMEEIDKPPRTLLIQESLEYQRFLERGRKAFFNEKMKY